MSFVKSLSISGHSTSGIFDFNFTSSRPTSSKNARRTARVFFGGISLAPHGLRKTPRKDRRDDGNAHWRFIQMLPKSMLLIACSAVALFPASTVTYAQTMITPTASPLLPAGIPLPGSEFHGIPVAGKTLIITLSGPAGQTLLLEEGRLHSAMTSGGTEVFSIATTQSTRIHPHAGGQASFSYMAGRPGETRSWRAYDPATNLHSQILTISPIAQPVVAARRRALWPFGPRAQTCVHAS